MSATACSSTFPAPHLPRRNKKLKFKHTTKKTLDGRHALLSAARRSNERMASEFDALLKGLESQGLVLAQDVETKELLVLSEADLEARAEEARRTREEEEEREREAFIAPIPPSARIEREEVGALAEAAEATMRGAEEGGETAAAAAAAAGGNNSKGGRLLLQSGTAGGSLGGSAPLTAPVSSGGNPQLRPGQQAAFAAAGGTSGSNATGPARPGGGAGAGGAGGAAAAAAADPARFLYSGPAVGVTVPNSIARVLPQFPANFNGTRPVVQTNPLSLLANGVYQGNIYSGGTSRSPALATVPTPTPPAPVMVYQPRDPINVVRVSSGISDLTNANAALSVVSNWPFNDFRNNFPNQNVASAGSLRTLFCATPLTQWCTNTLPIDPALVNSMFQGTQNPNFLIG